jgi:hypothetical protein
MRTEAAPVWWNPVLPQSSSCLSLPHCVGIGQKPNGAAAGRFVITGRMLKRSLPLR